ncbi:MAG TPA: Gfo/Idh/MocA family oxidoreductase [Candidatus Dormibacteraeota bacterium]|nr:Gfo/Idh/MocA family oxidoreductase [Candidatus Dormibacteraeota bacterium]
MDAPACDGDRRIGLGVIGAGQIVRERHVPGFKRIRGVELVGVVNRSPESSRRAQEAHGFQRTYGHWRELIDDAEVDAVLIATWPYLHAPITLAALDAGKHVLTQARMAMDGAEARAMLAASRAHPELVAMVVPSPFTLQVDRTIQRLLREQAVGEVRSVRVLWAPGTRDPEQRLHWRHQRELSGNNVMALGVAYEAMARWLGQAVAVQAMTHVFDPYKVAADGGRTVTSIPDHVALMAEFPGPVFASLEMSLHASSEPTSVRFFGTAGTIRVHLNPPTIELATGPDGFQRVQQRPDEIGEWRAEEEFIAAIRGEGEVHLTDFATGAAYMAFTDAVHDSALGGRRVTLLAGT